MFCWVQFIVFHIRIDYVNFSALTEIPYESTGMAWLTILVKYRLFIEQRVFSVKMQKHFLKPNSIYISVQLMSFQSLDSHQAIFINSANLYCFSQSTNIFCEMMGSSTKFSSFSLLLQMCVSEKCSLVNVDHIFMIDPYLINNLKSDIWYVLSVFGQCSFLLHCFAFYKMIFILN